MQNNKSIIILEPEEGSDCLGSIYLERSVFGVVVLVNVYNYVGDVNFKLVLTDQEGFSHLENVTSNCYMFKLTNSFSVGGDMAALIYDNDKLILSGESTVQEADYLDYDYSDFANYEITGNANNDTSNDSYENITNDSVFNVNTLSAKDWAMETNQLQLFNEANEIINKAKAGGIFCYENSSNSSDESREEVNKSINDNNGDKYIKADQVVNADCNPNDMVYNEKYNINNKENEIVKEAASCNSGFNCVGNETILSDAEAKDDSQDLKKIYTKPKAEAAKDEEYDGSVKFSDIIGNDFDMLYNMSLPFNVLNSYVENSDWRKLELSGSVYYLCRINGGKEHSYFGIGIPVLKQNRFCGELGKNAEYISLWPYDDFGFLVLLQDARNGKAIKLNGNMC